VPVVGVDHPLPRTAEQQPELGPVGDRPRPEGARHRQQLVAGGRGVRGVADGLQDVAELVVDIGDDVLDEVLAAGEVAVEGRCGHAHLPGDRAQGEPVDAVRDEHPPRRLLDLLQRVGPGALAAARRIGHRYGHESSPSRSSVLTSVNTVCRVSAVS
jgi:hypothetical protein